MTVMFDTKLCTKCGLDKDPDEFGSDRNREDGKNPWCKQCCRDRYHERYRGQGVERCKERYQEHRDEENERARQYHAEHQEYFVVYRALFGALNWRLWYWNHHDNAKGQKRLRHHLKTLEEEAEQFFLEVLQYDPCVYCGTKTGHMTRDHIVPFACGGDGSAENITPACGRCNAGKKRTPLLLYLVKLGTIRQGMVQEVPA